ncbi:MAG TPA: FAD-binding oxidoreductase [Thermoleophilaceae bacterium]
MWRVTPIHTPWGYWLEEAGPVTPEPPLEGDLDADVVIAGGGYTGMWTAWWLTEHAPDVRIVLLEAELAGHGPSGRNGGFCTSLWDDLAPMRERFGNDAALAVARASSAAVDGVGEWCSRQGVDAWYRAAPHLVVSAAPAQDGAWDEAVAACAEVGEPQEYVALSQDEVRARCDSPVFRGGAMMRSGASVQPARLSLGLRAKLLERGVQICEHSPVRRLEPAPDGSVIAETPGGRVRAGAGVLATGGAMADVKGLRRRLTVASSHIVLTEPVPDVLDEVGWTGGEPIADARAFLHYFRTTNDDRIVFGWAGGRLAYGGQTRGRIEVDPAVTKQAARDLVRTFPQLRGRRITHAWGGPIDVSPTHLPMFGTLPGRRVHYSVGYTGNGVAPSHLAGQVLASLALDRRDEITRLPLVDPPPVHVPPEPFRWVGGEIIRAATLRKEAAEERGEEPSAVSSFVSRVPKMMGVHIGR